MNHGITRTIVLLAAALGVAACDEVQPAQGLAAAAAEHGPAHVDSIFPIEEEVRRFRAALPDSAVRLEGGAGSRDELVARFIAALEARDVAALDRLVITPAEFAYLYYPHTRYTAQPYEMAPALLWFQLENYGSKGLTRALARYGGRPLDAVGHACPDEPLVEERNRTWPGCVVLRTTGAGDTTGLSLFGGILERDGRFKFINYANRL